jgi:hypothetical protein
MGAIIIVSEMTGSGRKSGNQRKDTMTSTGLHSNGRAYGRKKQKALRETNTQSREIESVCVCVLVGGGG